MLNTLAFLNKLNHNVEGMKVSYDIFHLTELGDLLDIRVDYVLWLSDPNVSNIIFYLLNLPNTSCFHNISFTQNYILFRLTLSKCSKINYVFYVLNAVRFYFLCFTQYVSGKWQNEIFLNEFVQSTRIFSLIG